MTEFRLDDLITIVRMLIMIAIIGIMCAGLYAFWPQLWQLLSATRRRFLYTRWPDFINSVADDDNMSSSQQYDFYEDRNTALDTDAREPVSVPAVRTTPVPVRDDETDDITVPKSMKNHDLVALLAVQKTDDDKPRWSANEIAAFVGGTRKDVLEVIRSVRGETPKPAAQPMQQYRTLDAHSRPMLKER